MGTNTYYLEMMSILLNIFQPQELINKTTKAENLFLRREDKRHQKKNLVVNLLKLIQVTQKEVMIQTKLVKYKYLSVNSKTKKKKKTRRRNKKKLKLQLTN